MSFAILHDNGLPICFIGQSFNNQQMYEYLAQSRSCEIVTLEHAEQQPPEWFQHRQFACFNSEVAFKQLAVDLVERFGSTWISMVGDKNNICRNFAIGKNTMINNFNDMMRDNSSIGDHCVITCYSQIGTRVTVSDFCHISSYCYLNNVYLEKGVVLGLRCTITGGHTGDGIRIKEYTNIVVNSTINKSNPESGTYYNRRRISSENSLTHRIL